MDYEINGKPFEVVTFKLKNGESVVSESGAMSWMSPNMEMKTSSNGGIGKVFGRMFAGESLFQNIYTSVGDGVIAFAAHMPGEIRELNIEPCNEWIIQKKSFLASQPGVKTEITLKKKLSTGLFGGEGFIMQRLYGNGKAFIEIDGSATEYNLAPGQQIIVSTGFVAAMSASCTMDIRQVPGVKNMFFGGEGLFNTVVTGPGKVILQSMPVYELAKTIIPYIPTNNGSNN